MYILGSFWYICILVSANGTMPLPHLIFIVPSFRIWVQIWVIWIVFHLSLHPITFGNQLVHVFYQYAQKRLKNNKFYLNICYSLFYSVLSWQYISVFHSQYQILICFIKILMYLSLYRLLIKCYVNFGSLKISFL